MEQGFRSSMNVLHTWAGLVVGALLFAIFWMGTLSVYDNEIDRWMAPMTRVAMPDKPISFDALRGTYDAAVAARARSWTMLQPTERQPVVRIVYRDGPELVSRYFDPVTGAALPETGTWAGTRFFYPFHYRLHLKAWDIGEWLVGIATMAMLLLCVSGIVIHRKMIAEFFTLRTRQKSARMVLDLHTVAGVLGLPFNFMIALSGLIILSITFFPSGWQSSYPDKKSFNEEAYSAYSRPKANKPGTLVSLDELAQKAQQIWDGSKPWAIVVQHPGDAAAFVTVYQSFDLGIVRSAPAIHFDAATGAVLHQSHEMRPIAQAQRFLSGMHQIQFRHWMLRALYFALGLFGCVLILTGFLFWLQSRRRRHAAEGRPGVRVVEAVAVGSTAGIIVASISFMVTNRILPLGVSVMGIERYALEIWVFYLVWLATFAHAWWRPQAAWAGQCLAIAALAVLAVALNWVTTGDHLLRSISVSHLWPVAGVDFGLLALASTAFGVSRWLLRAERPAGAIAPGFSRAGSHG
ncbi:PepSY-associated TM helix [Nitrobacter hamburgensis X14]|uniref:PepSY-associated TM helix n=2 Tax=Nitrobacter hamburgensis TaxID=912 RepID=Q1QH51_NITHX|nr:PepSY-associated TM helix [Nitrobacter hamburgensis X14]